MSFGDITPCEISASCQLSAEMNERFVAQRELHSGVTSHLRVLQDWAKPGEEALISDVVKTNRPVTSSQCCRGR